MRRRKLYILLVVALSMVFISGIYLLWNDPHRNSREQRHDACRQVKDILDADPDYCVIARGEQATDPNLIYVTVVSGVSFEPYRWVKPIYPHLPNLARSRVRRLFGREKKPRIYVTAHNAKTDDLLRIKQTLDKGMYDSKVTIMFSIVPPKR